MSLDALAMQMGWQPKSIQDGWILRKQDSLRFLSALLEKTGSGVFDMIFADPPYFLSNDGISCQAGKRVSVNKGEWDKLANVKGGGWI